MSNIRRNLPPPNSLVAFEAAARHLNFTRAARELAVTQAAVSRQMRVLEENLGAPLFERLPHAVRLTQEGLKLQQAVAIGLSHIAQASTEIRQLHRGTHLTVSTTIAFATYWLVPRMARFRERHPAIEIRLVASDPFLEEMAGGIDVSIRYGRDSWPDSRATLLLREEVFPVCSHGYLRAQGPFEGPSSLQRATLLHLEEFREPPMNWSTWLQAYGLHLPALPPGPKFYNYPSLIDAVKDGAGVALGWRHLVDEALAQGTLVRPVEEALATSWAYYLVIAETKPNSTEVEAFVDWVVEEVRAD